MLIFFALAQAGQLDVTVTVGDETATFSLDQMASCSETKAVLVQDGRWAISARATGVTEGQIYVDLDVEVETGERRNARRVEMRPRLMLNDGEKGTVVVGTPGNMVEVAVVATNFEADDRCVPESSSRSRRTSSRRERG